MVIVIGMGMENFCIGNGRMEWTIIVMTLVMGMDDFLLKMS